MHRVALALALLVPATCCIAGDQPVPRSASTLVATVHSKATSGRVSTLIPLLAKDFISSFGGDGGPEEAERLWNSDSKYLQELAKATKGPCALQAQDYVECPASAGSGYRAGFKLVSGKWTFASFVAGD